MTVQLVQVPAAVGIYRPIEPKRQYVIVEFRVNLRSPFPPPHASIMTETLVGPKHQRSTTIVAPPSERLTISTGDTCKTLPVVLWIGTGVVVLEGMRGSRTVQEIVQEWPEARIFRVVERMCGEAVIGSPDAGARVVMSEVECLHGFHLAVRRMSGMQPYLGEVVTRGLAGQGVSAILLCYNRVRRLSQREVQVLQQISEGCNTRQVADRLCVSVKTIDTHRARIMEKLSIRSIAGLTKYAIQIGITEVTVY